MADLSAKDYIRRAKELEVAIFTQKSLMTKHEECLMIKRPQYPTHRIVKTPSVVRPQYPQPQKKKVFLILAICVFLFFGGLLVFVPTSGSYWSDDSVPSTFIGIIVMSILPAVWEAIQNKRRYDEQVEYYESQMKKYNETVAIFNEEQDQSEAEFQHALSLYNIKLAKCKEEEQQAMLPHTNTLHELEAALNKHYEGNVLFPKYRNLVAVSTIDEYLQSGRCETLEGSNGAYNLYEMELRQNIVIGQLSTVLNNMEQIKNNQYTLYQELSRTNILVSDIITEIRELNTTGKLNAYFAAVNAQIAASPTYIHGHIY